MELVLRGDRNPSLDDLGIIGIIRLWFAMSTTSECTKGTQSRASIDPIQYYRSEQEAHIKKNLHLVSTFISYNL